MTYHYRHLFSYTMNDSLWLRLVNSQISKRYYENTLYYYVSLLITIEDAKRLENTCNFKLYNILKNDPELSSKLPFSGIRVLRDRTRRGLDLRVNDIHCIYLK